MDNIWITSDTFFGRSSLAKERGFDSVESMDAHLIQRWNSKVSKDDIVWHLGNFAWDSISVEYTIPHLNGNINIIKGEYDILFEDIFEAQGISVHEGINVNYENKLVMSHWPMLIWPGKNDNFIQLHANDKQIKSDLSKELRLNMNYDLWSLSPVSLDSILDIINTAKSIDVK